MITSTSAPVARFVAVTTKLLVPMSASFGVPLMVPVVETVSQAGPDFFVKVIGSPSTSDTKFARTSRTACEPPS